MHQFFPGVFFNFETVRILGMARYGGADVAEVLEAVGKIKHSSAESWHDAWEEQAEKALAIAKEARACGNRTAARRALLRAANYTRASGYMFTGDGSLSPDPRTLSISEKSASIFHQATQLFDHPVKRLQIPYEDMTLEGYIYLPSHENRIGGKIPIVIANNGADSTQQEIYFIHPAAGPELGYAVVTFDGPGQGLALHRDGLRMRPDWETVTGAVLDHLESIAGEQPELELDLDRVAIAGASLGGYFALRAAADPRVKAVVAIDPVYDLWDFAMKHVNQTFLSAWGSGWISDGVVDAIVGTLMRLNFQSRWELTLMGNLYGLRFPSQIMRTMKKYTLKSAAGSNDPTNSYLEKVRCPAFVTGAGKSLYLDVNDHTSRVYNGLTHQTPAEKHLWLATSPADGGLQAKIGAVELCNQRVFCFLDHTFKVHRQEL
ncbi:hypothetical protein AJ79_00056 [Helicocarpus griseus UAMH5409]|uniref:AB hydrolase-1 domain-containing protein n=1 Tax=Helicocarpus griseus UAMH5409 TaxID=1447875 RepID=A0A2B7YDS2_9EURO|nr:hypothetical protein AJ79_00056 [Helicocarpus griseus UAMH5409]